MKRNRHYCWPPASASRLRARPKAQPSRDGTLIPDEIKNVREASGQFGKYGVVTGQHKNEIAYMKPKCIGEGTITTPSSTPRTAASTNIGEYTAEILHGRERRSMACRRFFEHAIWLD